MNVLLQQIVRAWFAAHPDESESEFARRSGLTKAAINNIKNKASGGGLRAVEGIAIATGVPYWQICRREYMARSGGSAVDVGAGTVDAPVATSIAPAAVMQLPTPAAPALPAARARKSRKAVKQKEA